MDHYIPTSINSSFEIHKLGLRGYGFNSLEECMYLGSGGEGYAYRSPHTGLVVKIYNKRSEKRGLYKKLFYNADPDLLQVFYYSDKVMVVEYLTVADKCKKRNCGWFVSDAAYYLRKAEEPVEFFQYMTHFMSQPRPRMSEEDMLLTLESLYHHYTNLKVTFYDPFCDIHEGNYGYREDNRLIVFDF